MSSTLVQHLCNKHQRCFIMDIFIIITAECVLTAYKHLWRKIFVFSKLSMASWIRIEHLCNKFQRGFIKEVDSWKFAAVYKHLWYFILVRYLLPRLFVEWEVLYSAKIWPTQIFTFLVELYFRYTKRVGFSHWCR